MYEYIFLGVISVDEPVTALNVEPFYGTGYFVSCIIKTNKIFF